MNVRELISEEAIKTIVNKHLGYAITAFWIAVAASAWYFYDYLENQLLSPIPRIVLVAIVLLELGISVWFFARYKRNLAESQKKLGPADIPVQPESLGSGDADSKFQPNEMEIKALTLLFDAHRELMTSEIANSLAVQQQEARFYLESLALNDYVRRPAKIPRSVKQINGWAILQKGREVMMMRRQAIKDEGK